MVVMKKIFFGKVECGKVLLDDKESYKTLVGTLEGKEIEITIAKKRKTRSNRQLRYYWGVVLQLFSDYTGHTQEELHDALRIKFLKHTQSTMTMIRSTTTLSTVEMEEYLAQIRQFAATNFGLNIPEPHEVQF